MIVRRLLVATFAALTLLPQPGVRADAAGSRPNVLIIVSDDQSWSTFSPYLMPTVYSQLVDEGALFTRGYVDTPVCCPSRAEILTGLYGHHTNVIYNISKLKKPTIVQALHDAGYRTGQFGKYLNSWPCWRRPEFDRWVCSGSGKSDYSLVDPTLNVDGTWQHFQGYTTDILASFLSDFVASTPADQPFFALYAPTTPHLPANDDRYASLLVDPPRPPSYDEPTFRDGKPRYMWRHPLAFNERWMIDVQYRRMARAVRALDDSVATVLASLGDRAANTLVFYLSDNGYLYGEHRRWDKGTPYEESVRVPFIVRWPAVVQPTQPIVSPALVENVDIAPTMAEAAGIPWEADGHSLLPLLDGEATSVRTALLTEACYGSTRWCPGETIGADGEKNVPGFWAIQTHRWTYVEYGTGERELYDRWGDRYELVNLARLTGFQGIAAQLAARLLTLRTAPPH